MELKMILAADYANTAERGKLNVMGIFTMIYAPKFPALHPSMSLVLKFDPDFTEYGQERKLTVTLVNADATVEIARVTGDIKIPTPTGGQKPEININLEFKGLVFPQPGRYQFSILIDKDFKGSLPIDLIQIESKAE